MIERGHDGRVYVLGSGDARPLRDYLTAIVRPFGVDITQCLGKVAIGASTPRLLAADISDLREHLGWEPRVDFSAGVERTIKYCTAHPV